MTYLSSVLDNFTVRQGADLAIVLCVATLTIWIMCRGRKV
jgi:hypothetical protein